MITARASPFFLSWSSTSSPPISGRRTSSRTRSGDSCCATFSPGSPASASTTWYPHSSHFWRRDQRTSRSSSTIRIFSAGMQVPRFYRTPHEAWKVAGYGQEEGCGVRRRPVLPKTAAQFRRTPAGLVTFRCVQHSERAAAVCPDQNQCVLTLWHIGQSLLHLRGIARRLAVYADDHVPGLQTGVIGRTRS